MYCNKSYYLNNFSERILVRECFPVYLLQIFWGNALRKLLLLKSNYNKFLMISEGYLELCQLSASIKLINPVN